MSELHLKQPGFTYNSCGVFTKYFERIQKFRKTVIFEYIYRNELDQVCFPHYAAHSDSKNVAKRTIAVKILKDRASEIYRNPKYHGYQRVLASMVHMFFDKKNRIRSECKWKTSSRIKPVIKNFKSRRAYAKFKDNIWAADLAEKGSLSSKNCYLLCFIDVYTKYAWVKP